MLALSERPALKLGSGVSLIVGNINAGGGTCILVEDMGSGNKRRFAFDCGLNPEHPAAISRLNEIMAFKPGHVVLTHGHFDHIGLMPMLLEKCIRGGVFLPGIIATEQTIRFLRVHTQEVMALLGGDIADICEKKSDLTLMPVKHSIPGSAAALYEGSKNILFTGDFWGMDVPANLPEIDLLIVDCTGALKDGQKVDKEPIVKETILGLAKDSFVSGQRTHVALFSTHVERASHIASGVHDVIGRYPAMIGRNLIQNMEAFGWEVRNGFAFEGIQIMTGAWAQGYDETEASALVRLANGGSGQLYPDDTVILSASAPYGKALRGKVAKMCQKLHQKGAKVVVDVTAPAEWKDFAKFEEVHSGGHGNFMDIINLIMKVRPKSVLPFHASLAARQRVAEFCRQKLNIRAFVPNYRGNDSE